MLYTFEIFHSFKFHKTNSIIWPTMYLRNIKI